MSLEEYTQTSKTTHEQAKQTIHRILQQQARGRENAISSQSLADRVGVKATTVRDLVPLVRAEYGVPIGSSNGYFLIEEEDEFRRQVERQRRQAEKSLERAREISSAWYQSNGNKTN